MAKAEAGAGSGVGAGFGAGAEGPPPRSLRPLLRLSRFPAGARPAGILARALDEDDEFRSRVAAVAGGDRGGDGDKALDRPSWLFLARPDGWEEELSALLDSTGRDEAAAADTVTEQRASRRLEGAMAKIGRLEAALAEARTREARLTESLSELRAAADRAPKAGARRPQPNPPGPAESAPPSPAPPSAAPPVTPPPAAPAPAPAPAVPPPVPPPPPVDVERVARAIDAAASAARSLTAALDEAATALTSPPPAPSSPAPPPPPRPPRSTPTPAPARQRRPPRLPPGLFDDSAEAAEHLMRVPGMVVLVDGYNTTLSAWPGLPLPEQRRRLVDALAELAARTGVDAHAVFDGVEAGRVKPPPGGRLPVRVTFTPAGVDADDVILDLVESMASHRPVAVASNDREVQGEARERGAAVLTLEQLFGVLRRQPRG